MGNNLTSHVNYYEQLGRNIFLNYLKISLCSSILFSTNSFAGTDVQFTTAKKNLVIGEIKYRKIYYNQYPDLMIEEKKYDELKNEFLINKKIPVYISITSDGYIFIQDLREYINNDSLRFEERYLQANDFENDNQVLKSVSYLPINSPHTQIFRIENSSFIKVNPSDIKFKATELSQEEIAELLKEYLRD